MPKFTLPASRRWWQVNLDARLTPSEAARLAGVSRQLFNWWRCEGKIQPGSDGLYRAGDVLAVERQTRNAKQSSRCMKRRPDAYHKVA
jgi:hypothetical protein